MTLMSRAQPANPWHALWAMLVGFFMILVDATIVAVANPAIMDHLDTDYDSVIWVTSAYLLAYAVPLLLAGRLGDRFGPKNVYLIGLAVFTVASLGCGLAGSIGMLIAARVVQGLGAALLTPQTLSTITRLFPPERRGVAMSLWGATAGVATLVGPLVGGLLVDGLGWQWIFIVNVPIGIIGLGLAFLLVPDLPTEKHDFDILGVLLSGAGIFLVVFALQEGQTHDWAFWICTMIVAGLAIMAGFVYWQSINPNEPLIPLTIFRDNDFSLSNVGVAVIGFAVTAMVLPLLFYAQAVSGLSPTRSALLMAPMAITSGVLAPGVGKLVDWAHPRPIVGFGFSMLAIALTWLSIEMTPTTPIWRLVLPMIAMGVGMAFIWAPLAATATRNLPPALAGAGSGVYNATRQVGSVLGSAGIAAFMSARISAEMPGGGHSLNPEGSITQLPRFLHEPFSAALSQSLLLPAFVALFGVIAALFLRGAAATTVRSSRTNRLVDPTAAATGDVYGEHDPFPDDDDDYLEYTVDWDDPEPHVAPTPPVVAPVEPAVLDADYEVDDTDAIAVVIANAIDLGVARGAHHVAEAVEDEGDTERLSVHVAQPLHAPAETWHGGPAESWQHWVTEEGQRHLAAEPEPLHAAPLPVTSHNGHESGQHALDDWMVGGMTPRVEETDPIGFAHNGFNVKPLRRTRGSVPPPSRGGRHSRGDEDAGTYGRHSMPHGE